MSITIISRYLFFMAIVAISYLATAPQGKVTVTLGWDKLNHLFAFFVLLGLLDYAYPKLALWRRKIVVLVFYAVAIELVQGMLPDREASLLDIVADVIGLAIFLMLRPSIKTLLQEK